MHLPCSLQDHKRSQSPKAIYQANKQLHTYRKEAQNAYMRLDDSLYCFGATQVRAYDDRAIGYRAIGSFVRNSYVSTLCPVVICPYLRTPDCCVGAH